MHCNVYNCFISLLQFPQWLATAAPHFYHVVLLFGITDYLLWFITAKVFDALKQWNTDLDIFKSIQEMHCLSLCSTKGECYGWHGIVSCWRFAKEKLAAITVFFIASLLKCVPLIKHCQGPRGKLHVYKQCNSSKISIYLQTFHSRKSIPEDQLWGHVFL